MIDLKNRYEVLMKKVQHLGSRITELEEENFKLKKVLAQAKEDHQYDNLVHKKELIKLMKIRKSK